MMDIMDRPMPVNIEVFTRLKFPEIKDEYIDFLVTWRDTVLSKMPFTGWSLVMDFSIKKVLINAAQEYSNYLNLWADERELYINGGGNSVSDENIFDDGIYRD